MREILFRGKRVDNGQWIYGGISIFNGDIEIFDSNSIDNGCYEVVSETVGQLWVVSGIEFFGGDLFTAYCSVSGQNERITRICKVVDSDIGFSVEIWHEGEWWAYSYIDFTTAKIIGNIHDNPNLLTP